jgi:5-methylcytosine-specific restriction endonuclease McrA
MGCAEVVPCPQHSRKRLLPARHDVYNSKRWKVFRQRILKEHPWCEHCVRQGKPQSVMGCSDTSAGPSQHVHHKVDLADGGAPFDPDNVEALSQRCHSIETRKRQNAHKLTA